MKNIQNSYQAGGTLFWALCLLAIALADLVVLYYVAENSLFKTFTAAIAAAAIGAFICEMSKWFNARKIELENS